MNKEQDTIFKEMMLEGFCPKASSLAFDVIIFIIPVMISIFLIGLWTIAWAIPVEYMIGSGKPKWLIRRISLHWYRMYKLQDKLRESVRECKK